jgi:DeoR family transcriptional regulator, fructose operon transcriptional repressor
MLPEQRRRKIVERMQQDGAVDVDGLARSLGVSHATIRRDLRGLAADGAISRTHGGAVTNRVSTAFEPLYSDKARHRRVEKAAIARLACDLVEEDQVLALDSGSTTGALALELKRRFRRLTVITTDLQIAIALCDTAGFEVILAGGTVRPQFYSAVGPIAEAALSGLRANQTFIGADAIDLVAGVTNATLAELGVKRRVMEVGERVVLLGDHAKFDKVSLAQVAPIQAFDMVLTDAALEDATVERYRDSGVDLRRACA